MYLIIFESQKNFWLLKQIMQNMQRMKKKSRWIILA